MTVSLRQSTGSVPRGNTIPSCRHSGRRKYHKHAAGLARLPSITSQSGYFWQRFSVAEGRTCQWWGRSRRQQRHTHKVPCFPWFHRKRETYCTCLSCKTSLSCLAHRNKSRPRTCKLRCLAHYQDSQSVDTCGHTSCPWPRSTCLSCRGSHTLSCHTHMQHCSLQIHQNSRSAVASCSNPPKRNSTSQPRTFQTHTRILQHLR